MNPKQFENMLLQIQINALIWTAIIFIATLLIWYWVTRLAVRDGMKDAIADTELATSWRKSLQIAEIKKHSDATLPDIRAER